ncbi:hypothetical protein CHUAL_006441 [Chamberlinius hualienensis]
MAESSEHRQFKVEVEFYDLEVKNSREKLIIKSPQLPSRKPAAKSPTPMLKKTVEIPSQSFKWSIKIDGPRTRPQYTTILLDNSPYEIKLLLDPSSKLPELKLHVQMSRNSTTSLLNGGYGIPLIVNMKYGRYDTIGKSFNFFFGQKLLNNDTVNVGEAMLINYSSKEKEFKVNLTVNVDQLEPVSTNGWAQLKIEGFSRICTMSDSLGIYNRTLTGPMFYTSPEGYLVKLEILLGINIEAVLTFIAGKFDRKLPANFLHVTTIVLFNTSKASKVKHISRSKVHNLALGPTYRLWLATMADLIDKGYATDDCLRCSVNIHPLEFSDASTSTILNPCSPNYRTGVYEMIPLGWDSGGEIFGIIWIFFLLRNKMSDSKSERHMALRTAFRTLSCFLPNYYNKTSAYHILHSAIDYIEKLSLINEKNEADNTTTLESYEPADVYVNDLDLKQESCTVEVDTFPNEEQAEVIDTENSSSSIKRPANGFISFSAEKRKELSSIYPNTDNRIISKYLAKMWNKMSNEERSPYKKQFEAKLEYVRTAFPDWNYAGSRAKDRVNIELQKNVVLPTRLRQRRERPLWLESEIKFDLMEQNEAVGLQKRKKKNSRRASSNENVLWVQCDSCLKWRRLPQDFQQADLPETWFCYMNPDEFCNKCYIPEENSQ